MGKVTLQVQQGLAHLRPAAAAAMSAAWLLHDTVDEAQPEAA